jgi:hypothetical protein
VFRLPVRSWIRNAAAVFTRRRGAVSQQAQHEGCSRQTAYQHARKLEARLSQDDPRLAALQADNQQLRQQLQQAQAQRAQAIVLDTAKQQQLAVTACAMGLSLRQIEELLALLLPAGHAPDHATVGRWTQAAARQAQAVLAALDPPAAARVKTLCADEIFFGG